MYCRKKMFPSDKHIYYFKNTMSPRIDTRSTAIITKETITRKIPSLGYYSYINK